MALKTSKNQEKRASKRTRRRQGEPTRVFSFFESSRFIAGMLFLVFAFLVTGICFWRPPARSPGIAIGQKAVEDVVASFEFTYPSKTLTEQKKDSIRSRMPPSLSRVSGRMEQFERKIHSLDSALREFEDSVPKPGTNPPGNQPPEAIPPAKALPMKDSPLLPEGVKQIFAEPDYGFPADARKGLQAIYLNNNPEERTRLLSNGLTILKQIYKHSIYSEEELPPVRDPEAITLVSLDTEKTPEGQSGNKILSLKAARDMLSFRIREDRDIPGNLREPMIHVFVSGLTPNLHYDDVAHAKKIRELEVATPDVIVTVGRDEVILRSGEEITKEKFERYIELRKQELERGKSKSAGHRVLARGVLLSLALLGITWICLKIGFRKVSGRNRLLGLSALGIVTNLLMIRILLQVVEAPMFENQEDFLSLLPYLAPTAFAPLILAIFAGPTLAILGAFLVSLLFSLMLEGSTEIFVASFFATLTGIFLCRNISQRSRLMQACLAVGAVNALLALLFGMLNEVLPQMIGLHILACFGVSVLTGMMVIGVLPILENAFKFITDIRLLELTDTNHELLRRMQMEAPGTYHHSLMVANLSENAAVKLGANPLKCRACSLFHDIGKLVKPEYFMENQVTGMNPHDEKSPSMSALIIKSHIPEGVELAKKYKLPRIIIEVIRQHHGTSLIHYFYHEAQKKSEDENGNSSGKTQGNGNGNEEEVDESTYRYPGPKPEFKESAIIFFADAVEAASRSLQKINAQSLEELIDNIFDERLEDGQLDECPLTFQEVSEIKKSFAFTILNMTHARQEYPDQKEKREQKEAHNRDDSKSPFPEKDKIEQGKATSSSGI